jgi:hypothetical protein
MKHLTPLARLLLATALAALAGCAHNPDGKPAICDGRHRRPANPYGSVLPNLPGAAAGPAIPGAVPPPPPPALGPLSALDPRSKPGPTSTADRRAFAPCGGRT